MDDEQEFTEVQGNIIYHFVGRVKIAWTYTGILVFLTIYGFLYAMAVRMVFF